MWSHIVQEAIEGSTDGGGLSDNDILSQPQLHPISKNHFFHTRTKHIELFYHFVHVWVLSDEVELVCVPTDRQAPNKQRRWKANKCLTRGQAEWGGRGAQFQMGRGARARGYRSPREAREKNKLKQRTWYDLKLSCKGSVDLPSSTWGPTDWASRQTGSDNDLAA